MSMPNYTFSGWIGNQTAEGPIHYRALSYDRQTLVSQSDSVLCLIGI